MWVGNRNWIDNYDMPVDDRNTRDKSTDVKKY